VTQQPAAFSFLRHFFPVLAGISLVIIGATGAEPPQRPSDGDQIGKHHEAAAPADTGRGVTPSRPHNAASAEEQRHFVQMLILSGVVGHPFGFFK
jgi:hypothetical protein